MYISRHVNVLTDTKGTLTLCFAIVLKASEANETWKIFTSIYRGVVLVGIWIMFMLTDAPALVRSVYFRPLRTTSIASKKVVAKINPDVKRNRFKRLLQAFCNVSQHLHSHVPATQQPSASRRLA